jgi:deoxyribodipyrimidine photolyase-related protein
MIKNCFLLFPIHLFKNINLLKGKKIYLIEDPRYFTDFNYHKLKIAYHRATMKSYYDYLINNSDKYDIIVEYIDFNNDFDKFYNNIKDNAIKYNISIKTYDVCDNILKNKLIKFMPDLVFEKTLNFLVNEDLLKDNIDIFYNNKKYNHQKFYKWQRIRLNILIDKNNKPIGGKWSFDKDNRKKIQKDVIIPKNLNLINNNEYVNEAIVYVEKHFKNNYGSLDNFIYPIDHNMSNKWLKDFLKNKFENFGLYEDAVLNEEVFLFHSVLSPMMNIGLLTDTEIIEEVRQYENKVSINSYEGFIRQIIGWRNYIYSVYLLEGENIRKSNFFKHNNRLNKKIMWEGKTNILPIDNTINKIVKYSYIHHIERLMYLGNYMLLCMINPNDIYEIFMEWTIDAYDWVMVPNVYCMSQYSDGGLIMTRPYFCSSNYILKMSNYKKGDWCELLDILYYNFINHHKKYLKSNYSTSIQVSNWNKKTDKEKKIIIKKANNYLYDILI